MTSSAGTSERSLAQVLGAMTIGAMEDGVPADVASSVGDRVLDIVGICIAAADLPTSKGVQAYALGQGGVSEAQAVGIATPLPAALAALVNGTLAHSLDYDDTHLPSVVHPSATVVPACLAAAELAGADGERLVRATAAGLEICVRLGMAGYDAAERNSTYFDRGQHATSLCGAIGGAAGAAALTGLDEAGVVNAMGVAASMASGIIEANRAGGTVKRLHCGWAAHAAISAVGLVRHGFTGPPTVLEGRFGFFQAFLSGHFDPAAVTDGLGTTWSVPGICFKPYPANHFTHAGIDAAIALRDRGVDLEDVVHIRLGVPAPTLRTVGEPIDAKRAPETGYQAQFSGPYTVVAAMLGGSGLGLGLDDFTDELARSPQRRRHMAKVEVFADERCSELFPDRFPGVVEVRTKAGATLVERVDAGRGSPERPLSPAELAEKFSDNARRGLDDRGVAAVRTAVDQLAGGGPVSAVLAPARSLAHQNPGADGDAGGSSRAMEAATSNTDR